MRVPDTPEMKEMWKKIKPYLIYEGLEVTLAEDAPEEIRKIHDEYFKLFDQRYREVWEAFNPQLPLPED